MDEPLLLSRDHQILGEPETKQPVAQHHAWSLTTLAQTLGCRIRWFARYANHAVRA
jgi:hypothetical protein